MRDETWFLCGGGKCHAESNPEGTQEYVSETLRRVARERGKPFETIDETIPVIEQAESEYRAIVAARHDSEKRSQNMRDVGVL